MPPIDCSRRHIPILFCYFSSFLASGDFCHLLITFANSLQPDQDLQNVVPDLDQNCLIDTLIVFLKDFFEKFNFEKSADENESMKNYQACKR